MTPAYERYAEALFSTAESLGCLDQVACELPVMEELIRQCDAFFKDPLTGADKKCAILRETLSGQISPLILEYIILMITRRHLKHFSAAAGHFRYLNSRDKAVVQLRVPFEPDPGMLERLRLLFREEKLVPENVKETEIRVIEDKGIIGGFVAYYDGYQIDASLKTAISKLRRESVTQGSGT